MARYFLRTTNTTCNPEVFKEFDDRDVETVSLAYYFIFSHHTLSGSVHKFRQFIYSDIQYNLKYPQNNKIKTLF